MDYMVPDFSRCNYMMYVGDLDTSRNYNVGDVAMRNGKLFVFTGDSKWDLISEESEEPIVKKVRMIPKTCICCGAPLSGNKCEYCLTEYTEDMIW